MKHIVNFLYMLDCISSIYNALVDLMVCLILINFLEILKIFFLFSTTCSYDMYSIFNMEWNNSKCVVFSRIGQGEVLRSLKISSLGFAFLFSEARGAARLKFIKMWEMMSISRYKISQIYWRVSNCFTW